MVDTGAVYSGITEKEATIMKIDCSSLPFHQREAIGIGGPFRNKMINREIVLTFRSGKDEYKTKCSSFIVICIPPSVPSEQREKMIRYTPNVLGMDILSKFKTYVDKNEVWLTV